MLMEMGIWQTETTCNRYFATSAMICYDCGALHNHHLPVGFGVSHQALGMQIIVNSVGPSL